MTIWFLVGYMWFYVHRPFEMWAFAGLSLAHLYLIIITILWLFSIGTKRQLGNIFTPALLLYTFAITTAALFSPHMSILNNWTLKNWLVIIVSSIIFMTSVKTERDLKIILTGFVMTYFIFMAHTYWIYLHNQSIFLMGTVRIAGVRGGGDDIMDPNYYATALVCVLPMVIPLLLLCKKYWHYLFVLGYILLTVRNVLLSGSRTSLIMLAALAVLPALCSRHRFKLIPIVIVACPIGWMSMSDEMKNRYRTIWDPTVERTVRTTGLRGSGESTMGRIRGFYTGIDNWLRNPLVGVGPGSHMLASGSRYAAHNLPGQVAGELGTLGIVTFMLMVSCFGINHYHNWKNYKYLQEKNLGKEGLYCWRISIAVMYALVMMLLQGVGLHNAFFFQWAWLGAFHALATMIMQEKVDGVQSLKEQGMGKQ
jgi:hypothetical protein